MSAIVVGAHDGGGSLSLLHSGELRFVFIMKGSAGFADGDAQRLGAGDAVAAPPGCDAALDNLSADFMALEVDVPRG